MGTNHGSRPIRSDDVSAMDAPTVVHTRPLPVHDGRWHTPVDQGSPRPWTPAVLAAAGILAFAVVLTCILLFANAARGSGHDVRNPPLPAVSTTMSATPTVVPGAPVPSSAAPDFSPTATASAITGPASPVPPSATPGRSVGPPKPGPKPTVRQRLHDLFPRLFPNP